jgi:hypothetical protein
MKKYVGAPAGDPVDQSDAHTLASMFRWSMDYLDTYERSVQEGCDLHNASDFARFIMNCGISDIMVDNPAPTARLRDLFPYDGKKLFARAHGVFHDSCWAFKEGKGSGIPASVLKRLDHKLDLIAGRLSVVTGGGR